MSAPRGCTQCGNCLNTCPVYTLHRREEYSPKAKQELLELGQNSEYGLDWRKTVDLAGRCACCERCLAACPRKLSVPEVLSRARSEHPRWQQYFWREWIRRGSFLWAVAARVASLAPRTLLPRRLKVLHAAALAMTPPPDTPPWLRLAADAPPSAQGVSAVLFGGCTATRLRPLWMRRASGILRRLGATVQSSAGFDCCGGTFGHAGMLKNARAAAEHNLAYWRSCGRPRVVTICASCLHSLRRYPAMENLLCEAEGKQWLDALTPLSVLLREAPVTATEHVPARPGYHSPCHWGTEDADLLWLRRVLPELRKGDSLCCGFGGVLKMLEPLLSRDMAEACWHGLCGEASPPAPLEAITGCSGCVMQLAAHAPAEGHIRHWLDVWEED